MHLLRSSPAFGSCQFLVSLNDASRRQSFVTPFRPPWRCRDGLSGQFMGTVNLRSFSEQVPEESEISVCKDCTGIIGSFNRRSPRTKSSGMDFRAKRSGKSRDRTTPSRTYLDNKRTRRNDNSSDSNRFENASFSSGQKGYRKISSGSEKSRLQAKAGSKPSSVTEIERLERLGIFGLAIIQGSPTEREEILDALAQGDNIPSTTELNEVLTSLCRARRMEDAHNLMDALINMPEVSRTELIGNVKTYTIMIDICGKSKQLAQAFTLFYGMQSRGLTPNAITYNSIIAACSRNNEPELAFELFTEMEQASVDADKFTFGALIDSCAKNGKVDMAFELAELMDEKKITKDATIYSALMDACGRANQVDRAFSVYLDMKKAGIFPNLVTFSLLIDTCANCRHPDSVTKAFQIFSEIQHWGFPHANVVVYTALINCCSKSGFPELGKKVLASMVADKIDPNPITFGAYIDGWSRAGLLDEAFEAMTEMMKKHRCEPNAILIGGLIDATRRMRQFHRAKRLWEIMVQFNVRISRIFYPSLMAMAARNGDVDVAIGIAYYVLGTGFLRRCFINSDDPFSKILAYAIVYVKHTIDSTANSQVRRTRQTRMAVLYESTAITDEEMMITDPEYAFNTCISWGDFRTRNAPRRLKECRNGSSGARQAMILGRESVRASRLSTG